MNYHNGWSGNESGECCDKCRMENPKDPLQRLAGCKNPFQLEETCQCHIPHRKGYLKGQEEALSEVEDIVRKFFGGSE